MITLICGMPRAGKTTYAEKYENVQHSDLLGDKGVLDVVSEITEDVVVEGLYFCADDRIRLLNAYSGEGKKCIWIDTPLEVRKIRPMWNPYTEMVFDPPTLEEGWDEIIIIRGDDDVKCSRRQTED